MGELGTREAGSLEFRETRTRTRLDPYVGLLPAGVLLFFGLPLPFAMVLAVAGGLIARAFVHRLQLPAPKSRRQLWTVLFLLCVFVTFGFFGWFSALTGNRVSAENVRLGVMLCVLFPAVWVRYAEIEENGEGG